MPSKKGKVNPPPSGEDKSQEENANSGESEKENQLPPEGGGDLVDLKEGAEESEEETTPLEGPEEGKPSAEKPAPQEEVVIQDVQFDLIRPQQPTGQSNKIDLLLDVTLPISVQLGKTSMTIQELLEIGPGSVIELDKIVGSPVEILANNKTIAQGEVVVVDENFGVRITSLISPSERIKSLR